LVVELLAAGWSHAQILASDPHLTEEDIRACLANASELLREEIDIGARLRFSVHNRDG